MVTAAPLAADGYVVGVAIGSLLPLALGIGLLVMGLRRRRATAPAPTWGYSGAAVPTAAPGWGAAPTAGPLARAPEPSAWPSPTAPTTGGPSTWPIPPTEPVKRRGTGLVIAGAVLIALSVMGGAVRAATLATTTERRVALPASVLGLPRDEAASAQVAESALKAAPADLIDPRAALYGTPGLAVLVIAARTHTAFPSRQLDSFRKGFEGSGGSKLTDGRDVNTGTLGGAARCWVAHISGTQPGVCIFVDRGSLVATIDFLPGGVEEAAKRGLKIREATVHKT